MSPDRTIHDDAWWVWCGNEGGATLIGPFWSTDEAQDDIEGAVCHHDHVVMRGTCAQVALRLPEGATSLGVCFYDNRGRRIIGTKCAQGVGLLRDAWLGHACGRAS